MIPVLSADTARCAGSHRPECADCLRRLSPPHERQVWMGPWVIEDEPCPSKLKGTTTPSEPAADRGG